MYIVRLRIGDFRTEAETSADFATLYRAARTVAKCGKRNGFRTRFVISDMLTGETIVRLYSLKRDSTGEWMAAQSGIGKYHRHINF